MDISSQILSDITVYMKYARYLPELKRRETWHELVTRNKSMHIKQYPKLEKEINKVYKLVYDKKILPSMRSMQFAGKSIEISPNRVYNCAYLPIDDWRGFGETMFLLLGGTGVGYSVQKHHVEQLPEIHRPNPKRKRRFLIGDSIEGWADAVKVLMKSFFYGGSHIKFDFSDIRPKGAMLITSGGKAPGPQPLKECIVKIQGILTQKENGDKLTTLEVHDIVCYIADAVLAGGIRRAALISLFSADDDSMISCKVGNWWEENPQRGRSNNSAVLVRSKVTEDFFFGIWEKIKLSGSGEPGIYLTNDKDWGTNPCCIVGGTYIAVADGREPIKMIDLVSEGNDVPVYTINSEGNLDIETMHNPKLIKENVKTYKVNFSNGTNIIVDESHKFIMKDGSEKAPLDLIKNDSIESMTVFETQLWNNKNSQHYRFINHNGKAKSEHRIIAEKIAGRACEDNEVVHHIDFNALNNHPTNLRIMTKKNHDILHSKDMIGEKNCVHRIKDRESWLAKLSKNARGLNNPKAKYWETNDIISMLSSTILIHYNETNTLLDYNSIRDIMDKKNAPIHFNKKHFRCTNLREVLDNISQQIFNNNLTYLQQHRLLDKQNRIEWPIKFENNEYFVYKPCEYTGEVMKLPWKQRETSFSSHSAQMKYKWEQEGDRIKHNLLNSHKDRKDKIVIEQAKIFNDLVVGLNRRPYKKEWVTRCKEENISPEISRKSSPLSSYAELEEVASMINHRVLSVEYIGKDNVYSGTVPNTHTYFAIGNSQLDKAGRVKYSMVLNRNCEIALRPYQFCNLTEVNISNVESQDDLNERVKGAAFIGTLQAGYSEFHYLRPIWQRTTEKDALIGVSMTGIASNKLDDLDVTEAATEVKKENKRVADLLGIKSAARCTTVKPSGTASLVLGTSSGIHAWHNDFYIRRLRVGKNEAIYGYLLENHPELVEDEYFRPHDTAVISVPQKAPENATMRTESAFQLLERVKHISENYVKKGHRSGMNTHNVSATISVKDGEWDDIGQWMWKNKKAYNGLSILPYDGGTYKQAPFEDCEEATYEKMLETLKEVDLFKIVEEQDDTNLKGEIACSANGCEIV